jgi:hypothetical protein
MTDQPISAINDHLASMPGEHSRPPRSVGNYQPPHSLDSLPSEFTPTPAMGGNHYSWPPAGQAKEPGMSGLSGDYAFRFPEPQQ